MSEEQARARAAFEGARDPQRLPQAVVRFHRHVDEVLARSHEAHAVTVACRRGCSMCCHMQVEMLPPEAFSLAAWLRRHFAPAALEGVMARLRANVARIREIGVEARRRTNLPCYRCGTKIRISNGELLAGQVPNKVLKQARRWVEAHHAELLAMWNEFQR